MPNVPGIIHIGYMRSGSAYLRSYFTQHPDIHWTRKAWFFQLEDDDELRKKKYLDFFKNENSHKCFIDMYESICLGYVLNKTPSKDYANEVHPEWESEWAVKINSPMDGQIIKPSHVELARRIKYSIPNARILIGIRNQIDWFRSMYLHYLPFLPENNRRFIDFLSTLEGKSALYAGFYDQLLQDYAGVFGRENMHVMMLEELAHNENETLAKLCNYLQIPFHAMDHDQADRNKGLSTSRSLLPNKTNTSTRSILPNLGKKNIRNTTEKPNEDILSEQDIAMIRSVYSVSNYLSSKWLDIDLKQWGYPS